MIAYMPKYGTYAPPAGYGMPASGSNSGGGTSASKPAPLPQTQTPQQEFQKCVNDFYSSKPGKVVQFLSPLSLIPAWNPNASKNQADWAEAIASKGSSLAAIGSRGQDMNSIISGSTKVIESTPEAFVSRIVDFLEPVGYALLGLGTVADLTVRSGCTQAAHPAWATFSVGD